MDIHSFVRSELVSPQKHVSTTLAWNEESFHIEYLELALFSYVL